MTVAFIVQINLDDLSGLPDVAAEIVDDLSGAGFDVIDVQPWKRPSLVQQGSLLPTTIVPQTNQNQENQT